MTATRRKSVRCRQIGCTRLGPVSILRITYINGVRTWGVSDPGSLVLFGSDRAHANRFAREVLKDKD